MSFNGYDNAFYIGPNSSRQLVDESFLPLSAHPLNVSSELTKNLGHHAHYVPTAALPTGTYSGPTSSHGQSNEPIAARFTGMFRFIPTILHYRKSLLFTFM